MKFFIDQKIFHEHPNLKIGVLTAKNVNNIKRISAIASLLRGASMERHKEFEKKALDNDPRILRWREAYALFGAKPSKYQCSIEALLTRIMEGKTIPSVNSLVDMGNYISLKYVIPVGVEDMDKFFGDIELTYAMGEEYFRPIGTVEIQQAKPGEIIYKDKGGVVVRRWNYREAERTKTTRDTRDALIVLEDLNNIPIEEFEKILYEFQDIIERYIGGDVAMYILNEDNHELDLEVEGLKKADDSKISEKEKIFFMAQEAKKEAKIQEMNMMNTKVNDSDNSDDEDNDSSIEKAPAKDVKKNPKTSTKKQEVVLTSNPDFLDKTSYKYRLTSLLKEVVGRKFPEEAATLKIEYPKEESHGDYASNVSLKIASKTGLDPRKVAEALISAIEKPDYIDKIELAGPGFINFYLAEEAFEGTMTSVLKEGEEYGESKVGKGKAVVMDYSSPNIAKPLGVHHLLSTIIGQSLYDIYNALGFTTISVNHIGDWGTQFGKLIYAYKNWGTREAVEEAPIPELLKLYVKFHDEAERHEELEDAAREEFKKLENGDEENKKLWKWFVDVSLKDTQKTYNKLGNIHFDYTTGESFYEDKMQSVIDEGVEKKVFKEGEEGALIARFDDPNMAPFVIKKSDGATLYSTRDLATFKYRLEKFDPVKLLYIVDVAQSLHFKQLFDTARQLGWKAEVGDHVIFGRMQLPDGNMSTRKGNVILLDEVLDEATKRAMAVIEQKSPELENKEEAARIIGIGAVKYNILSQNRTSDIVFEWDKMLSIEGNSAPYLQYTYARAKSILRKAKALSDAGLRGLKAEKPISPKRRRNLKEPKKEQFSLFEAIEHLNNGGDLSQDILPDPEGAEEKEALLLRQITKFGEFIALAAEENKPNLLSNYLYDLAQKFNSFYNGVPVVKADKEEKFDRRIGIVKAAAQVLKNGLALLQVEVLEEM